MSFPNELNALDARIQAIITRLVSPEHAAYLAHLDIFTRPEDIGGRAWLMAVNLGQIDLGARIWKITMYFEHDLADGRRLNRPRTAEEIETTERLGALWAETMEEFEENPVIRAAFFLQDVVQQIVEAKQNLLDLVSGFLEMERNRLS
jgi:hypothetical protein